MDFCSPASIELRVTGTGLDEMVILDGSAQSRPPGLGWTDVPGDGLTYCVNDACHKCEVDYIAANLSCSINLDSGTPEFQQCLRASSDAHDTCRIALPANSTDRLIGSKRTISEVILIPPALTANGPATITLSGSVTTGTNKTLGLIRNFTG